MKLPIIDPQKKIKNKNMKGFFISFYPFDI